MSKPLLVLVIALMIISFYNGTGFNGYDNVTKEFTPSGQLVKITREYQPGKSLWDWLQLLIIPVVLGIGGFWLSQATLASVDLSNSSLVGAILSDAEFMSVDLSGANLQQADLSSANLKGVIGITIEELEKQAKSLQGAILPDGSKHP